jgi:predicted GH43/DUF377 family glycosyl hydrolase
VLLWVLVACSSTSVDKGGDSAAGSTTSTPAGTTSTGTTPTGRTSTGSTPTGTTSTGTTPTGTTSTGTTPTGTTPTGTTPTGTTPTGTTPTGTTPTPSCVPVDPDPGLTSEGHPADGWGWSLGTSVFADHGASAGDGDLAPALATTDDGLLLLFARKNGLEMQLMRARWTVDGWSDPEPVGDIPPSFALYPALAEDDAGYRLWVGSGSFDAWSSADGDAWRLDQAGVLRAGGDFDSLSVLYPSVARDGAEWRMLYTGFDGRTYAIGEAVSDDGLEWSKRGAVIELRVDAWDNTAVAQPALVQGDSGWWSFYGGYDTSLTDPGPYRIGVAREGVGWEPVGVSVPLGGPGALDAWSTRDPAVVRTGEGWRMVYAGLGEDGVYRLLEASSDSCG